MYARLLATFCLSWILVVPARSDDSAAARTTLLVYLDASANRAAATLPYMRHETEKLLRAAGYQIEWREARGPRGQEAAPNLAFVELSGACALPSTPSPAVAPLTDENAIRLASTPVVDGVVLPFSRIDCAVLTNAIGPMLSREPAAQRTFGYGRAMGRLVAHELYHILAQTRDHSASGIGRPCFTPGDLIADRFEFESVALARLRRANPERAVTADEASGR